MYISEALTYNCSSIQTAASHSYRRASSIGLSPKSFLMLIDAPCPINIAMVSVEFFIAARCMAVSPQRFRLFTFAPFCRSNRKTSALLNCAALKSAVLSSSSTQSTGAPSFLNLVTIKLWLDFKWATYFEVRCYY